MSGGGRLRGVLAGSGGAGDHGRAEGFEGVSGGADGEGLEQGPCPFGPSADLLPGLVDAAVPTKQLEHLRLALLAT